MKRFLTRNIGWKLAALATSFLLWLAINGANDSTASVSAPVQYRNIPSTLEVTSDMTEQVHLIMRGPSLLLSRAAANPTTGVLDLSDATGPGERTFTITAANIRLPGGVVLERAIPGQIRLRLERRGSKAVPVRARLDHVPEGMVATVEQITPSQLTIVGPENRVQKVSEVETDAIDVQALGPARKATVSAYTSDGRVSFEAAPTVTVKIALLPQPKH